LDHPSFLRLVFKPRNLLGLAEIARRRHDLAKAQDFVDQARKIADDTLMRPFQAEVALAQGQLAAARGDHDAALEFFADARARAQEMTLRPIVLEAQRGAAVSFDALGRSDQAAKQRAQAEETLTTIANLISDVESRRSYLEHDRQLQNSSSLADTR
jgi:hypothetical protein